MKSFTQNTLFLTSASCSSSWQSKPFPLQTYDGVSVQAAYSGSFNGTLRLQVSNDNGYNYLASKDAPVPTTDIFNWTDVPDSTLTISGSFTGGNAFWNYPFAYARWLRAKYEATGSNPGFVTSLNVSAKGT